MNEQERQNRIAALKQALKERILVLDGATGTYIQELNLTPEDFGGEDYDGCNEHLVLTRPDLITVMHEGYLEAGADIIETNTFGGVPFVLEEYGLGQRAREINRVAAQLARAAADHAMASPTAINQANNPANNAGNFPADSPGKLTGASPRFVAGSMGPTTKAITVTGGATFFELEENFHVQALGLIEGGVDFLLVETSQDTRNVKAALLGIARACQVLGTEIPTAISVTIEPMGSMLAGQGVEAFYASIMHADLLYLGLNCATGPAFMTDHVRTLSALSRFPLAVVPNAGLPDEDGIYLETPEMMGAVLERFMDQGWVNLIGGCCGTHLAHVRTFEALARGKAPRTPPLHRRSLVSGIDFLEMTDEIRPVIVGERTNSVGSRLFKRMIVEERFEEAAEIARRQVNNGAQVIDVNMANPDRDELADMEQFLSRVIQKIKAPLMIDSTDAAVIELALPYSQGKAIINSINLEDGEERFATVVPLARKFGAALIVGTIDDDPDQGMGVTVERKLAIARRSHDLLTEKYGVLPEDIIFDPLVFPCATGDVNYIGSAEATIEGVRAISEAFPLCKTVLGISNVSFGLPAAGREVLNAVFLYHCVQAGLDMAIVNSEKLERYASISEEEKKLADNLLFNRGEDPVADFANHFRDQTPASSRKPAESLPLEERLSRYIVDGSKDGLVADLEEARKLHRPMDIINGPLMAGMEEVGRLFNDNQLIVAEVLQSAEAMKTGVSHLEQFLDKEDSVHQGTMLLATVKGDVHDIGKNLVEIIFSNNGYKVINLGIKCPPETLIAACREHSPDLIGLSGLLVKSAQQMVVTAEDLNSAGIAAPMLVGGAALSRNFTHRRIAPAYGALVAYAKDAMDGLELANAITDPEQRETLEAKLSAESLSAMTSAQKKPAPRPVPAIRSGRVRIDLPIPPVTDLERHVLPELNLDEVWSFINPQMLYGKHLGLRGNVRALLEKGDAKAVELREVVESVKVECRAGGMHVRAIWRFLPAEGEGNRLTVFNPNGGAPLEAFDLPRQNREDGMALPDFILPPNGIAKDHLAFFVTTAGEGIREQAEVLKEKGEYLRSHVIQALALETAEAAAEWIHARLRAMWGFPDSPEMTMIQRFQAKYRGKRYSFGYPACPNLEDQEPLFRLLKPESIGITLTDGQMMEPEASVSALVFHHPDAAYFSAGGGELGEGD